MKALTCFYQITKGEIMKKLILDKNSVIIYIGDQANIVPNGIDVGGLIYGQKNLTIVEVESIPVEITLIPYKYIYSDGNYIINQQYELSVENRIKQAIDSYTLELIEGGLL